MWYWKVIEGRRLIGHEGSVPGIATIMMANEQRNLGVIILTNGDIVRGDNQAKQVQQTINNITIELFNCFDKSTNNGFIDRSSSSSNFLFSVTVALSMYSIFVSEIIK